MNFLSAFLLLAAADVTHVAVPAGRGLPEREPAAVGMSAERLGAIDRVVRRGVDAGGYPGAAVVVGRNGYAVWSRGFGTLDWTKDQRVSASETLFDLASLTKVVATTTAIMILYDQGRIDLDAPVSRYLPAFSGEQRDQVTVTHLLTHHGGLPAGRELWRIARTPSEARAAVMNTPLQCAPGRCYRYSDLGADLLGFIVEEVAGRPLDEFLEDKVFRRLGMNDTHFGVAPDEVGRTAPTEIAPPRGYPLRGEVHDENAHALGGVAGHAGLFSTAADLAVFAQMMLEGGAYNGTRIVADSTVARFTRRTAGRRALGWDTCDGGSGCGQYMGEQAFGHTGFTGTSLWIDPERQMFTVLLTNRVHAARARRPAKVIADVRNDLADAAVLAVMDDPNGVLAMPASFRADVAEDWNQPLRTRRAMSAAARRAAARRAAARKASSRRIAVTKVAASKSATARTGSVSTPTTSKSGSAKAKSTRSQRDRSTTANSAAAKAKAKSSAKKPTPAKATASSTARSGNAKAPPKRVASVKKRRSATG